MGDKTKIEWADATWNPIRAKRADGGRPGWHCVKVSPGCAGCYAESMNRAFGNGVDYRAQDRAKLYTYMDYAMLQRPLRWTRPRRIFPCSMTDLFADWVPGSWIDMILAVALLTPWHSYLVTTKRPRRMRAHMNDPDTPRRVAELARGLATGLGLAVPDPVTWPLPNVWLGVSIEDQEWADVRVPELLATTAALRWVSAEPLLGPVDLSPWLFPFVPCVGCPCPHPDVDRLGFEDCCKEPDLGPSKLDWIVAGGESGGGARPAHPDWFRELRDQCQAADVRFLFKQWGQYGPTHELTSVEISGDVVLGMKRYRTKAEAGRLLDGREWNEFPDERRAAA